jgi:hypothetical protein
MVGQQSLFDFFRARLELVEPLRLVRSFSSEEALDLEFTEKTLHNQKEERQMGFSWKNNAKKGGFWAIFWINLEKEGVFGEGFWWNCVEFMEGFEEERLRDLTTIPRESTAGQAPAEERRGTSGH